jgi:hypothetical protein
LKPSFLEVNKDLSLVLTSPFDAEIKLSDVKKALQILNLSRFVKKKVRDMQKRLNRELELKRKHAKKDLQCSKNLTREFERNCDTLIETFFISLAY